jgi:hypothetical protein
MFGGNAWPVDHRGEGIVNSRGFITVDTQYLLDAQFALPFSEHIALTLNVFPYANDCKIKQRLWTECLKKWTNLVAAGADQEYSCDRSSSHAHWKTRYRGKF